MSVRIAVMEDLAVILAVERQAVEGPHWSEEQYREAIAGGADGAAVRRRVFVRGDGTGFAVGMVLDVDGVREAELEHVVVRQDARRRGIGQQLCEVVKTWAGDWGCMALRLEVRASNEAAIRLYERVGFRVAGGRKGYYREPAEDAVLMEASPGGSTPSRDCAS